jgi:predicted RNase H-like nuclease
MKAWYDGSKKPGFDMRAKTTQTRNERQEIWDSAILAAAEFVRRFDDYDETRALQIHELLSTKLPR